MTTSQPRQARAIERRETLLQAAAQVFAQRGFAEAQMDDIASAANTSKGGLYFHFPTKAALLEAVVVRAGEILRGRVLEAMANAGASPIDRADAALATLVETVAAHRSLSRVLSSETFRGARGSRQRIEAIEDEFVALIAGELQQAQDQGLLTELDTPLEPDLTARVWVGMVQATLAAWASGRIRQPMEQVYPELRRLLLRSAGVGSIVNKIETSEFASPMKE